MQNHLDGQPSVNEDLIQTNSGGTENGEEDTLLVEVASRIAGEVVKLQKLEKSVNRREDEEQDFSNFLLGKGLRDNTTSEDYSSSTFELPKHSLIFDVFPNLRDISVSSQNPKMEPGQLYRSCRAFGQSLNNVYDVLVATLGIRNIIDLRDDDLGAVTEELDSRTAVSRFYKLYSITASRPKKQFLSDGIEESHESEVNQDLVARLREARPDLPAEVVQELADNANTRPVCHLILRSKPKERKLLVVNLLDSPIVKRRVMEKLSTSRYLPIVALARLSDKITGNGWAPFYFCKFIMSTHDIFESYVEMIRGCGDNFATALKLLALLPGPSLFHCSLGKDRTGLLSLLVLHVLASTRSGIIFDYTLTEMGQSGHAAYRQFIVEYSGLPPEFASASAVTIGKTLEFFETEYGSVDQYLDSIKFGEPWRRVLRDRYLTTKN